MRLIAATSNPDKLAEIERIMSEVGLEVLGQEDFTHWPRWRETASDYLGNALIKAKAVYASVGEPVVADDSGLEVDCLGGAPGVMSSRYAGAEGDYEANNRKLLSELEGVPPRERSAKFVCVALCFFGGKDLVWARGECPGRIAERPSGEEGFGYDPVFVPLGYSVTMAELAREEKDRISHRGRALRELAARVSERFSESE